MRDLLVWQYHVFMSTGLCWFVAINVLMILLMHKNIRRGSGMLDGGPARIPKTSDRRSAYRRESTQSKGGDVRSEAAASGAGASRQVEGRSPVYIEASPKLPKWLSVTVAAILVIALISALGWAISSHLKNSNTGIDSSKHQAVFLSTGQVYFGKLEPMNNNYMKLTDVFYIQSGGSATADTSSGESPEDVDSSASMQLIKLGEEVHAPEDQIVVNKEHVLFYENIRPEGRVSKLIEDYKSGSN